MSLTQLEGDEEGEAGRGLTMEQMERVCGALLFILCAFVFSKHNVLSRSWAATWNILAVPHGYGHTTYAGRRRTGTATLLSTKTTRSPCSRSHTSRASAPQVSHRNVTSEKPLHYLFHQMQESLALAALLRVRALLALLSLLILLVSKSYPLCVKLSLLLQLLLHQV